MPITKYDKWFGGERGSASKALQAMKKQYGEEKGERVFYAKINKEKQSRLRKVKRG